MPRKHIDHSGETYGRLTLLNRASDFISSSGKKYVQYYCKCSCGKYTEENPILIQWSAINSGGTKSCGCLNAELVSKRSKKYNIYDLSNEYGIGYTSNDEEFYFDLEDYDRIKDYCWHVDTNGYIATVDTMKHERIPMHRLIMQCPKDKIVDHKHGESSRNDNRKSNLRIADKSQNNMNVNIRSNNTSGVTGVHWTNRRHKWCVEITVYGKRIFGGEFDNFDDAVASRKALEEKYFGEFSYDKSQSA